MISKRQRTKLTRWLNKWQRRLCLSDWTINCEFATAAHEEDQPPLSARATALASYRYLTLHITIYPDFWKDSDEEQERTVVHEMAHAITNHTRELIVRRVARKRVTDEEAADANERLTEHVCNVVWKAYR